MRRTEMWATVAYGAHGMGGIGSTATGVVEIDQTTVRWIPREGEGWTHPPESFTILTPRTLFNRPSKGLAVDHPTLGRFTITALAFAPGTGAHPVQHYLGSARRTGKLRNRMIAAGAREL